MKKATLFFLLFTLVLALSAQKYQKNFKAGETFFEQQEYESAIRAFSEVVSVRQDNDKAFNYLGICYEQVKDLKQAAFNFKNAVLLDAKNEEYANNLGRVYFLQQEYDKAVEILSVAIELDKKLLDAYAYKTLSLIELKKFKEAVEIASLAVTKKKSGKTYYLKALAQDSLKDYTAAEYDYGRAVFYAPKMVEAHMGVARTNMHLKRFQKAKESANRAIAMDDNNPKAYETRANIYFASNEPRKALDDFSRIISLSPDSAKYHIKRADIYYSLGQYQNAISDYSKAIVLEPVYTYYYKRGNAHEAMGDYKLAIKDYEKLKEIAPYDGNTLKMYDEAKARLFELNREQVRPQVMITSPASENKEVLEIPQGSKTYLVKGFINDDSPIENIVVDGKQVTFNKDTLNPNFEINLTIGDKKQIVFEATDVYKNKVETPFKVVRTEVTPPVVKLMAPYASDDGTIYLESDDPTLYVEGIIKDESTIKSIFVEGASANFTPNKLNPSFSSMVNILNKESFVVKVEDKHGNKTEQKFTLNRETIELLANNPMGKTWVVFIENSDYSNFSSLDGPTKDVTMMKSAFAKYKIHNIIHKKNMSKLDMERFFSIELRDLVRSNRVNSLLVWYAGHGKFINESGYWIPTDSKRDDEFSYFNISNLKAAMQSYSKYITHTLVVTDACESGPSFYQAMRSTPKSKSCNDWQATKFKSSQVFSSAGYELAVDNSQFTRTFSTTLSSNPNSCIPIETIVGKVKAAVAKESEGQKPKFGKIAGLEDENGTFFFIRK